MAGITVLISCDILGRVLFHSPIIGVPEIVKVSVVAIVWLQMAHNLKINGHLRSDAILNRLSRRGRSIVDVISYALRVTNRGESPAQDVEALVKAYGALSLAGGNRLEFWRGS